MEKRIQIGLVGDFSEKIYTHIALNEAIEHCRMYLNAALETKWIPTETISKDFLEGHNYDGFWITPGSPYKNDAGVYTLIQWSRENNFPIFGTCGGFQYMLVEYARNVLGFTNAGHEETDPKMEQLVISKLSCSLRGILEEISVTDKQSWLYDVLKADKITGQFNCSYGVNPAYQDLLNQYPMIFTAFSASGEPRALELKTHHFFKGTLFQPPLDSKPQKPSPLMISFFNTCAALLRSSIRDDKS